VKPIEFQDQMHFMSCQAEMLDEQGNDVSAKVMRDATKVLVVEHKRVLELESEVQRLEESLRKASDTQADQIMKMTDQQIAALCRLEGHDPKDEATIGRQVCEIALLKHELKKAQRTEETPLIAEAKKMREMNGKRPCDCASCDCGNSGDTYSAGHWDGADWVLNVLCPPQSMPTMEKP
jgi:hypothetical protein